MLLYIRTKYLVSFSNLQKNNMIFFWQVYMKEKEIEYTVLKLLGKGRYDLFIGRGIYERLHRAINYWWYYFKC